VSDKDETLYVYSGQCRFCAVGLPSPFVDLKGNRLFTGDIVTHYAEEKTGYIPRGLETLTVIVQDDFENFHGQEPKFVGAKRPAFVMGLAGCVPVKEPEDDETVLTSDTSSLVWHLVRVKSFQDVIEANTGRTSVFDTAPSSQPPE
jgi:hypothetical protein